MTSAEANIASIRELAKTADTETLRAVVNILCDRLEQVDRNLVAQKSSIAEAQQEIRRMSGVLRGR